MDLGVGKIVDTAKLAFLNFERFSWLQRLVLVGMLAWCIWAVHWVWVPRLDCSMDIGPACTWIGEKY